MNTSRGTTKSVFNEPPSRTGSPRATLIALAGAAAVLLAVAAYFFTRPASTPASRPTAAVAPAPAKPPTRREEAPAARPADAPPPRPTRRAPREKAPAAPAAPAPAAVDTPVLVVESDVAGASVFLDRKFLGTTPLRTSEVTAGTHQLNASVEGQDGLARAVEVGASGETRVSLRFREVTLDAAVPVVHKHGIGACEGRLVADVSGLRYVTTNKGDAFAIPFSEVESFEVDYLLKTLRMKRRGGKTWNFTDKNANADALFVFHRDVTKARAKLAAQ